ncbi:ribosomal protein S11 [Oesophagostomum dentatum]|nr:ribosomal protein S11 [Oesophagostomum dentatum]
MKTEFDGIPYCDLPIVYIKATKNNTLVTVMDKKNHVITYTSCRLEGFKHARKKTTIAGQTTGVAAGQRLVRRGVRTVRVQVKGLGPGRMTCVKGLTVAGVKVVTVVNLVVVMTIRILLDSEDEINEPIIKGELRERLTIFLGIFTMTFFFGCWCCFCCGCLVCK